MSRHRRCAGCGPHEHFWYERERAAMDLALRSQAEAWVWLAWFRAAVDALDEPEALAA